MDTWERRDTATLLLVVAAFVALCLLDLRRIAEPVFDEVYTLPAARSLLSGLPSMELTHPPLSKQLMALGAGLVGAKAWPDIAFGARLASVAAGALGVAAMYAIGFLARGRAVALVASLLLAADGMYFVMSRTAMTNIYGVAFMLVGAACLLLAARREQQRWVTVAGLAFGLAMASRWSSAVGCGVCGLALLWYRPRWVPALVLPALLAYVATFMPALPARVLEAQHTMIVWHTKPVGANPFNTPWWSWPLLLRPAWFQFGAIPAQDLVYGILCVGNVWIWWLALPALVWAVCQKDAALRVAGVWGLAAWLVWAPGAGNYAFTHYFFESVPEACLALAALVVQAGRLLAIAYVVLVLAWFGQFYPLLVGRPLTVPAYTSRLWLGIERWDFASRMNAFHREQGLDTPEKIRAFEQQNAPSFEDYVRQIDKLQPPGPPPP